MNIKKVREWIKENRDPQTWPPINFDINEVGEDALSENDPLLLDDNEEVVTLWTLMTVAIDCKNIPAVKKLLELGFSMESDEGDFDYFSLAKSSPEILSLLKDHQARNVASSSSNANNNNNSEQVKKTEAQLAGIEALAITKTPKVLKIKDTTSGRPASVYAFPKKNEGVQKEVEWQKKATEKFFSFRKPVKPGTNSHNLYLRLRRQISGKAKEAIDITGFERRSLVIALKNIVRDYQEMPEVAFKIGPTTLRLSNSSKNRQRGNALLTADNFIWTISYGKYCVDQFGHMTGYNRGLKLERYQQLASLMRARINTFTPFVQTDFNSDGMIKLDFETSAVKDTSKNNIVIRVDFLNGLLFLVTNVEVNARSYRDADGNTFKYADPKAIESDKLPVGIAQARGLMLTLDRVMQSQTITDALAAYNEFFGESPKYGADKSMHNGSLALVSGVGTIDNLPIVNDKLKHINASHNAAKITPAWSAAFEPSYSTNGMIISGKSSMYTELRDFYGSGAESDDNTSEYSNDSDGFEYEKTTNLSFTK